MINELEDFELLKYQCGQDLHPVYGTVLDTFPDISGAIVQGQTYLWDSLQKIKYNFGFDIDVDTFLTPKYINGSINNQYSDLKLQLPAICYNARFNHYKSIVNCNTINNIMFLDIDDFSTKEQALEYKTNITQKYDWIVACNLSLSKIGLHIIALIDTINDNNDFNYKYDYISTKYFNGRLDKSSKSLTRYTIVPYDYDIYINESPTVLEIDSIIRNDKKGMSSGYIKEDIISTAYTFSQSSSLNDVMNNAARKQNLIFKQELDESSFTDPNMPVYDREGKDIIHINLFPYRHTKIKKGNRNNFIGAISSQMIYLNIESPKHIDLRIKEHIFNFIYSINKKICDPPLRDKEVMNSFNANWEKYMNGELDVSSQYQKQRAFWSKHSTLKANEKRIITCGIKNEPIVRESNRRIKNAIDILKKKDGKITQKLVAIESGLSLPTVKKYWKAYKAMVKEYNTQQN